MTDSKLFMKLVANAIPAWPDEPRLASSIAAELDAPVHRVSRAIARIKEELPEMPLCSGSDGYRWSRDPVDAKRHTRKELRYVSTRTRRTLLEGLLEPFYQDCPGATLERARKRIEFILDDLAALSADTGNYRSVPPAGTEAAA